MTKNNNIRLFIILIAIASGILTARLNAQQFGATVDRSTVGVNETFQVDFTFNGPSVNGISDFKPPDFSGFRILSGPNQSTSMQFINGSSSASITYSYVLHPSSGGEFEIGQASVNYGGKTYTSSPVKVKVVQGATQPSQQNNNAGLSQDDIAKNVFMVAEVNRSHVYLGEQVTVTYKLYTRLNIASPQITKLPSYQGFWAEEIDMPNTINFELGMYKGERYRVATLKQVALFPSKTGKLSVTPFELNIPVIVRRKNKGNSVFDDFFNDSFFGTSQTVNFNAKSNTVVIQVDPLPSNNVPASFSGAVGDFSLKSEVDKNDIKTNESFTLRLTVGGSGNIKLLSLPEVKLPAGFEKYDPKVVENINRKSTITGQKIYDYLIIPRVEGEKEIPPVEFSYFNPSSRKYITLSTPSYKINVTKGEGNYETTSSGFSKEDIKLLSEDIRYIKTDGFNLQKKESISVIKDWFWSALTVPLVAFVGLIGFVKRKEKISGNLELLRFQKAEKAAKRRLRLAKKALDGNDSKSFYNELSLALFGYLEDKLNIQKSDFTLELALNKLTEAKVDLMLIEKTKTIAEQCEFARFAPAGDSATKTDIYNDAVELIVKLDSSVGLRKRKK